MKHPETHKRMTHLGNRKMRRAIAQTQPGKRPAARTIRRIFLRAQVDNVTMAQGLRKWAARRSADASPAYMRRQGELIAAALPT